MSTVGGWSFGERDYCGGRLDGGVEVGGGGVFCIVVRIVKLGYRRLSHKWEGGTAGYGGERKERRKKKKKGWQSESEAWGMIKRETCNFDLFYDLWTGPAGEINTDEAELKGISRPPYLVIPVSAMDFPRSSSATQPDWIADRILSEPFAGSFFFPPT
jgi:hypothetical protein